MISRQRRARGNIAHTLRVARGLNLADVARAAAVSVGYLSTVENARETPSAALTASLAAALDVDVEVITGQRPALGALRALLGVGERELAAVAGATVDQLARFEQGTEVPTPDALARMARRLGVPGEVLVPDGVAGAAAAAS